jgi:hypothetical protein
MEIAEQVVHILTLLAGCGAMVQAGRMLHRVKVLERDIEGAAKNLSEVKQEARVELAAAEHRLKETISDLRAATHESAKDQGQRLGKLEAKLDAGTIAREIVDDVSQRINLPPRRSER